MNAYNWLLIFSILFAILDWISVWKEWKVGVYIAKPATILFLLLWSFVISGWRGGMSWFGTGLIFSLAGDIFLMLNPRFFMPGMLAFFFTQICYLIGFNAVPLEFTFLVGMAAVIAGMAASGVIRLIQPALQARMTGRWSLLPFYVYFASVTLMLLSAWLCLLRPEWSQPAAGLAAGGGTLFFLSDSLLSYDRFVKPIHHGRFWVHMTYQAGQLALISGAMLHFAQGLF